MSEMSVRETAARACPFCEIVAGRAPGVLRREWDDAIALVPLNPVTPGHTLIVPKAHVANYAEDPNITAAVMRHAAEYAPAGASNLITSMGRAATQSVWHLHVHVIPRVWGDGLALPWDPAHAALSAELVEAKAEARRESNRADQWMRAHDNDLAEAEAERDALAAQLDALRAGIEGLADEYADAIPGFVRRLRAQALAARPAPAAEDEDGLLPIEQSLASALWTRWADPEGGPVIVIMDDPRTVARSLREWLVANARPDARVCYSDECGEPCQSWQAMKRAEIEHLRRENATIAQRLGEARAVLAARPAPVVEAAARATIVPGVNPWSPRFRRDLHAFLRHLGITVADAPATDEGRAEA